MPSPYTVRVPNIAKWLQPVAFSNGQLMGSRQNSWVSSLAGVALGLLLSTASMPLSAGAVRPELGRVDLRSLFGEPLQAVVPLTLPKGSQVSDVLVSLADYDAFAAVGLDRDEIRHPLELTLQPGLAGEPSLIVIKTRAALREPAFAVVVAIRTTSAVTYHVVEVVLDGPPPVSVGAAGPTLVDAGKATSPAPSQSPSERGSRPQPSRNPLGVLVNPGSGSVGLTKQRTDTRPTGVVSAAGKSGAATAPGHYGPTARFDTLYGIASQVRPDPGVPVRTMATALFHANPHAFSKSNINNLRLGVVLKVPAPSASASSSVSGSNPLEDPSAREFEEHMRSHAQSRTRSGRGLTGLAAPPGGPPVHSRRRTRSVLASGPYRTRRRRAG